MRSELLALPLRWATSLVPERHRPTRRVSRLGAFLRGADPGWTVELDDDGFGLTGAPTRWTWSDLTALTLFGGATPSGLVLQTADARLETVGRMLPVRAATGWSVARLERLAHAVASVAGVPLDDRAAPASALVDRAIEGLRARCAGSRDAHRSWFVEDPYPLFPPQEADGSATRIQVNWITVRVEPFSFECRKQRWAFADLDAVDLLVESERSPHHDERLWARIVGVVHGRPASLFDVKVTHGGVLQAGWTAEALDRAARAVPFTEDDVPSALDRLRGG